MKQFSAVDIYKWIQTQGQLVKSARISQIYRHDIMQLTFALHTKKGKQFLVMQPPRNLFVTQSQPESSHKETGFGTYMRQNLKGVIIQDIKQVRSERILEITFSKGYMYIELFNKGNIIITDQKKIIQTIIQKQTYKDRDLKKGEKYQNPESFDVLHASKEEFLAYMDANKDLPSISLFLATKCGLGGKYAEHICKESNIDPQLAMNAVDQEKIYAQFIAFIAKEETFADVEQEYFDSENQQLRQGVSKEIQKIDKIIESQKKTLTDTEKKAKTYNEQGEFIYQHFQFFQDAKALYEKNELTQKTLVELAKKHTISKTMTYKKPEIIIE